MRSVIRIGESHIIRLMMQTVASIVIVAKSRIRRLICTYTSGLFMVSLFTYFCQLLKCYCKGIAQ